MLIPDAPAVKDMKDNLIPEATYNVRCVKADYVAVPKSPDAKGPYINARFVITGPDSAEKQKGRIVFQNMGLDSSWLRDLLKVTGHDDDYRLTDTDELVGLECGASVTTQKGTNGYPDKSQISRFVPLV